MTRMSSIFLFIVLTPQYSVKCAGEEPDCVNRAIHINNCKKKPNSSNDTTINNISFRHLKQWESFFTNTLPSSDVSSEDNIKCYSSFANIIIPKSRQNRQPQVLQVGTSNGFKTDDMDWEFDEKAREDGYKLTTPEQNPYAIMLVVYTDDDDVIGSGSGTLLTLEWVLSSAHCFAGDAITRLYYAKVKIIAGSISQDSGPNLQSRVAYKNSVFTHPGYKPGVKIDNDIALVKVDGFQQTKFVGPIGLSKQKWEPGRERDCILTGFGRVQMGESHPDDDKRKTSYLTISSPCKCLESKRSTEIMVCGVPKEDFGICAGDSGAGLMYDREVIAVAAGGLTFEDIDNCVAFTVKPLPLRCGSKDTLSAFTKTYPHLKWIREKIPEIFIGPEETTTYDNPYDSYDYGDNKKLPGGRGSDLPLAAWGLLLSCFFTILEVLS